MVLLPQVRLIAFLHHFGIDKVDILRLSFLAPRVLPLPGSATTAANNVPSQLWAWLAGLVKVWRTEACTISTGQEVDPGAQGSPWGNEQ